MQREPLPVFLMDGRIQHTTKCAYLCGDLHTYTILVHYIMLQPAGAFSGSRDVVVVLKPNTKLDRYHNGVMEGEWEASTVDESQSHQTLIN
jgi:hypothetical protein